MENNNRYVQQSKEDNEAVNKDIDATTNMTDLPIWTTLENGTRR